MVVKEIILLSSEDVEDSVAEVTATSRFAIQAEYDIRYSQTQDRSARQLAVIRPAFTQSLALILRLQIHHIYEYES